MPEKILRVFSKLKNKTFFMLARKVPVYVVVIAFLFPTLLFSVLIMTHLKSEEEANMSESPFLSSADSFDCNWNVQRLGGYNFIRPLLYAEPGCESISLSPLKPEIENIINIKKNEGVISNASVYIREFVQANWMVINDKEKYSPGSLMKVPELIAFYKINEKNPGYLEKKVKYERSFQTDKNPVFLSQQIKVGETYTIRELLKYMIVYSDNNATILLNNIIDKNIFKKVFTDVGLLAPDFSAREYPITAKDFSIFMKELFNASYLSKVDSEACLELLSKSDFKDGLINGLPGNCATAHKFGEGGEITMPNFSESAIVYCGKRPYLLTVMVKGKQMNQLPKVISDISNKVYSLMSGRA
jgi:beta-lactamase class A